MVINGTLTAPFRCYGLAADYTVKIKEGVSSDAFFAFSVFGGGFLDGQVIINAEDDSNQWLGTAVIGETPLTDLPHYPQNSGNQRFEGAIGLAPFHMHNEGCSPPNIEGFNYIDTDLFNDPENGGVIIRYYGPIYSPTGGPSVVDVAKLTPYQDPEVEANWITEVDPYFTVEVNPSNVTGAPRSIRVKSSGVKNPISMGRYRVTVCDECFQCVGVDGLPSPVSVEYHFWIGADCFGPDGVINASDFLSNPADCDVDLLDCNCNGIFDACDIAHGGFPDSDSDGILNQCEGGNPCDCDWNNSGTLNSQDFFDYLACFFGS